MRFLLWPLRLILGLMVLISISLFIVGLTFKTTVGDRSNVLGWLDDSGVYQKVPEAFTDVEVEIENNQQTIRLDPETVESVAGQVLTEDRLKQWSGQLINGLYDWLEGRTDRPEFEIDLSEANRSLASGLVDELADNQNCANLSRKQNCVQDDADLDQLKADIEAQSLIGGSRVDSDWLYNNIENGEDIFTSTPPRIYGHLQNLWLYSLIALVALSVVYVAVAGSLTKGVRRLSSKLIIGGLGSLIPGLVFLAIIDRINLSSSDMNQPLVQILESLLSTSGSFVAGHLSWIAGTVVMTGVLLRLASYLHLKRSQPRQEPADPVDQDSLMVRTRNPEPDRFSNQYGSVKNTKTVDGFTPNNQPVASVSKRNIRPGENK